MRKHIIIGDKTLPHTIDENGVVISKTGRELKIQTSNGISRCYLGYKKNTYNININEYLAEHFGVEYINKTKLRNKRIRKLRETTDLSLTELGRCFELSRSRIEQICK